MRTFTVGTRGSDLALWQTRHVAAELQRSHPGLEVKVEIITTRGDVDPAERLVGKLDKGFFTAELEAALREKRIDFAVHSLKDLPTRSPEDLAIAAVLKRASPNDVLIIRPEFVDPKAPMSLKAGARVGASSLRRDSLLKKYAPQCAPVPLRGNVPTRVQRLREGKVDAILLAAAGLERLKLDLSGLKAQRLNPVLWPGAPGQGAVAVQSRADDAEFLELAKSIHHAQTSAAVEWERLFLRVLEGGCATPFGAWADDDGRIFLGQLTEHGWRSTGLQLPGAHPDEKFVKDTLPTLFLQDGEVHANWFTQNF